MKKAIFITVRTGSTRLPNKPIIKIEGKHTIEYVIDNVKKTSLANEIILCTTEKQEDLILCEIATKNGIKCFRGDEHNKWLRWQGACQEFDVDFFVNADGDDLFYEASLADLCLNQMLESDNKDIVIDGQGLYNDVYGISRKALSEICSLDGIDQIEPHHLVQFLRDTDISVVKIKDIPDFYKKKDSRMTLDYDADLDFFRKVIQHFGNQEYGLREINAFLDENPEVKMINYWLEDEWKRNQQRREK